MNQVFNLSHQFQLDYSDTLVLILVWGALENISGSLMLHINYSCAGCLNLEKKVRKYLMFMLAQAHK